MSRLMGWPCCDLAGHRHLPLDEIASHLKGPLDERGRVRPAAFVGRRR
jgi:hypothetical protein